MLQCYVKPRKSLHYCTQLTERTNLHFMVIVVEVQFSLCVSWGRFRLHRMQAIFHLVVGQYVRAFPMNLIPEGDQVHGVLAPPGIPDGTSWWFLHIQAAFPALYRNYKLTVAIIQAYSAATPGVQSKRTIQRSTCCTVLCFIFKSL